MKQKERSAIVHFGFIYPMDITEKDLIKAATDVRENAFAPFSDFRVGAAALGDDGVIYTGCNVESATYGLTMCAERNAIFKGVSQGAKRFTAIAVVADTDKLTPPCGSCRQIIWEFCGDVPVILANLNGKTETHKTSHLLPDAFDSSFL